MVAAVVASRPHVSFARAGTSRVARSAGMLVLLGIPLLLLLTLAWQLGAGLLRTDIAVRDAVAISRVSLESDPAGSRIDLVLVDRAGQDTTVTGDLTIGLREPDGTVWQVARGVAATDFATVREGGLLAGRLGYSVIIPASDWFRAPRRGGSATISVNVQPAARGAFSTVAEERFP